MPLFLVFLLSFEFPANLQIWALPFSLCSLPREELKGRKQSNEQPLPDFCISKAQPLAQVCAELLGGPCSVALLRPRVHGQGVVSPTTGKKGCFGLNVRRDALWAGWQQPSPKLRTESIQIWSQMEENTQVRIRLHTQNPHTDVRGTRRGETISPPF